MGLQQKLLIIGAGIGQVPLVKKAKEQGMHVTVASIPGEYPCFKLADDIICENIFNRDAILEEAKKRGISAVISDENDLMMPTVAYVSENLGLPGNRFKTVMSYCNKNQFRNICDVVGVPCPKHKAISKETEDIIIDAAYPWMVKPADSQSSIGVHKIYNESDLKSALDIAISKSPTGHAIVEEFFCGREVVCEGFINDGKYYLLQFADRKYFDLPNVLIPSQTLFPSTIDKQFQNKILEYESKLASFTKPSFAIVHSEYLINEDSGEIRIVESALRGGGVYISSDLIPMATGIDINDILLRKAIGINVNIEEVLSKREERAAAYICFYLSKGVIKAVSGIDELNALPFVPKAFVDGLNIGKETQLPSFKGARLGPILVSGHDRIELEENIKIVQQTLKVEIKKDNGDIEGINWD